MIHHEYTEKEITSRNPIEPLSNPKSRDVRSAYFLGPCKDSEGYAVGLTCFSNKLDALQVTRQLLLDYLEEEDRRSETQREIESVEAITNSIRKAKADLTTPSVAETLGSEKPSARVGRCSPRLVRQAVSSCGM